MPTRAATPRAPSAACGPRWAASSRARCATAACRPGCKPAFEVASPPLAEVIRDINKYSNNVMAQQLFLTLGLQQKKRGTLEASRATLRQWWNERIGTGEGQPVFDNGSGLSRDERISAAALAKMLQVAWRSPVMPELMSSLPAVGVDGTLRKRALRSGGAAHLKTGTLRDAAGVAGYVRRRAAGGATWWWRSPTTPTRARRGRPSTRWSTGPRRTDRRLGTV